MMPAANVRAGRYDGMLRLLDRVAVVLLAERADDRQLQQLVGQLAWLAEQVRRLCTDRRWLELRELHRAGAVQQALDALAAGTRPGDGGRG